jgi:hypothetical protein
LHLTLLGVSYSKKRNVLYIADTENHAIRCIDLSSRSCKTISGTGVRGMDREGGRDPFEQMLSSPWDVALNEDESLLYFSMPGTHQVKTFDLHKKKVYSVAMNLH